MKNFNVSGYKKGDGIKGIQQVMDNIGKEYIKIKSKSIDALTTCAEIIHHDVEHIPPITPADTGNLRASFYATTIKTTSKQIKSFTGDEAGKRKSERNTDIACAKAIVSKSKDPILILGFSANYALKVHENYGLNFKRPNSGAGFLVSSLKNNENRLIQILQQQIKV